MGRRDQVHGGVSREQGDVGEGGEPLQQGDLDRLARGVAHVEDAGDGMSPLAGEGEFFRAPVEGHLGLFDEQAVDQVGTLFRQDPHGGGIAQAGAGAQHVFNEQLWRVLFPAGEMSVT